MTLLLSDPKDFEGGELELFCGDTLDSEKNKFKLKQGYAVFFASFLLHRVMRFQLYKISSVALKSQRLRFWIITSY